MRDPIETSKLVDWCREQAEVWKSVAKPTDGCAVHDMTYVVYMEGIADRLEDLEARLGDPEKD